MKLRLAVTAAEINHARKLFEEYAAWLGVDLGFQAFIEELAGLPGNYAPPRGRLLLAVSGDEAAGCVALRPLSDSVCEMKRLFVRPQFRKQGLGRQLAEQIVAEARAIGYAKMQLDTLPFIHAAIQLYESMGFTRCPAYYDTPLPETIFMELILRPEIERFPAG